jgi:hypothetical protein
MTLTTSYNGVDLGEANVKEFSGRPQYGDGGAYLRTLHHLAVRTALPVPEGQKAGEAARDVAARLRAPGKALRFGAAGADLLATDGPGVRPLLVSVLPGGGGKHLEVEFAVECETDDAAQFAPTAKAG